MESPSAAGPLLWSEQDALIPARRLAPWLAALVLTVVVALAALGLGGAGANPGRAPSVEGGDAMLYTRVVQDVAQHRSYYSAAASELRRGGYPLRPFMTFRPPLLTLALARLSGPAARGGALALLAAGCVAAWAWRFRAMAPTEPWRYGLMLLLVLSGVGPGFASSAYLFHETWAGLLIALSLAVYDPRRWGFSLALGLVAALVRELAAPYLLVMALFALLEGRRTEASAWAVALAVFAVALASHAAMASSVTTASDLRSPGWLGLGGWAFALRAVRWNAVLLSGPAWLVALAFPPALLGLLCWPGGVGRRAGAVVLGYAGGFCVVGRPDNAYWGLMIAPLWPLGLIAVDIAVKALLAKVRRPAAAPLGAPLHAVR